MTLDSTTIGNGADVAPVTVTKPVTKTGQKIIPGLIAAITVADAIHAAFEYGTSIAGADGKLTRALHAYKDDLNVQRDMLFALNVAIMMKKLNIAKAEAQQIVNLKKHNDEKPDDEHRTFEQERIMISVRVLWSRAKALAGIAPKSSGNAPQTPEEKEARKARKEHAMTTVYPEKTDTVNEAMMRFLAAMRAFQADRAKDFKGDVGSAWRNWLASAPKVSI